MRTASTDMTHRLGNRSSANRAPRTGDATGRMKIDKAIHTHRAIINEAPGFSSGQAIYWNQ